MAIAAPCASLADCVNELVSVSHLRKDNGPSSLREPPLFSRLLTFGQPAVNALIPLLDDADPHTAGAAATALSHFRSLARPAIPALGRALARGNREAAGALAATDDDSAIRLLVADALAGQGAPVSALIDMGPRGQVALGEAFKKADKPMDVGGLEYGDRDLSTLVAPFATVAADATRPRENRSQACRGLADIGSPARQALPVLRVLAAGGDPAIAFAAERALYELGDPARTGKFVAELEGNERMAETRHGDRETRLWVILNGLVAIGPAAHDATLPLIEHARRAPWDDRHKFLWALTWVADARAVPFLTEALASPDWRVTLAAAHALGRLGSAAGAALPALATIEHTHWLPRAHRMAADARAQIAGKMSIPHPKMNTSARRMRQLRDLVHTPVEGYCKEQTLLPADGWRSDEDVATKPPPGLSDQERFSRGRVVTHAVAHGMLVGSDHGEFGGDLRWVASGREHVVRAGNVFAIVPRPWGLILLQGLAHLTHSSGTVSVLDRAGDGGWTAKPVIELPGAPTAFRPTPDGGIAVATTRGTLVLGSSGAVKGFDCDEVPPAP